MVLGVSASDWGARLSDGLGERRSDQRDVPGHTSHLIQLQGRRADHHSCAVVP